MGAKGTAVLDFGSGGYDCLLQITGQTDIQADSACEAWMSSEPTADHSEDEHALVPIRLRVRDVVAGQGFTIQAISDWYVAGTFSVRWVWA